MTGRMIDVADIDNIATGGAVLGTGGGGDPYVGKLMAQEAIRRHGPVRLIDADELADDALVVPVCMMGAPTVMTEKLPQGDELTNAFTALEKLLGRRIDAVLCGEAGGVNSTTPFVVAAATGLPLVDGDGMGRAFPELQMVTFTIHGVSATPMVLCDDKGNSLVLDTVSNAWTERLARAATIEMGGSALLAFYPMSGVVAKEAVVRGTLSALRTDRRDPACRATGPRRSGRGPRRPSRRAGSVSWPGGRHRAPDGRRLCPRQGDALWLGKLGWRCLSPGFSERVPNCGARRRGAGDHPRPHHTR